ncbi:MAG: alpha/beta hydrolase [Gemmatimonadales bacterium]
MTPVAHHLTVPRTARYLTLGEVEAAAEVWFLLHGYSMLARGILDWFEPAVRPGRLLVAPEGLSRAYFEQHGMRRVGASWMTKEDREVEIEDYVRYLDLVADRTLAAMDERPKVEVHGFSQGTATASRWVTLGRHRVDRLVLWGGGVPPDLDLSRFRSAVGAAPLVLVVGARDRYVEARDLERDIERLEAAGVPFELRRPDAGHRVTAEALRELDPTTDPEA